MEKKQICKKGKFEAQFETIEKRGLFACIKKRQYDKTTAPYTFEAPSKSFKNNIFTFFILPCDF